MSARELIAELQKFDPETPVVTTGPDGFDLYHPAIDREWIVDRFGPQRASMGAPGRWRLFGYEKHRERSRRDRRQGNA